LFFANKVLKMKKGNSLKCLYWNISFLIAIGLFSGCKTSEKKIIKPNILFCIADDASFPYMGAYGCKWVKTPAFDRIANEGLLFNNAYTPNAKCSPSRACILTGRNSWQLKEAGNHNAYFPKEFVTYVEVLERNGYQTGYTGKPWLPGNPGEINGQERQLCGKPYQDLEMEAPTSKINVCNYAGNFSAFLDEVGEENPWCFWYGGHEPHRAYEFMSGINKGKKKIEELDRVPRYWPEVDTVKIDMLDYAYEIEYFDFHLQRMLKTLEERGELSNTLIVVTSDNGMPFPRSKGQAYEIANHLPLAVMWADGIVNPGRTVNEYVSFIDFAPTCLEVAGVDWEKSAMASSPGLSLSDIFSNSLSEKRKEQNFVLIGKERHDVGRPNDEGYPIRGIVKDGWMYIENLKIDRWPTGNPETGYMDCDGSPTKSYILNQNRRGESKYWSLSFGKRGDTELYNIKEDPDCLHNLAQDYTYQQKRVAMKKILYNKLIEQEDPRMVGEGDIFDSYPYAGNAVKGFYERFKSGEAIRTPWINQSDFELEY